MLTAQKQAYKALALCEANGIAAMVKGGGMSSYLHTDEFTIRFSDHAPANGGGFNVQTGERHGDANLSVHPGGAKFMDAKVMILHLARAVKAQSDFDFDSPNASAAESWAVYERAFNS